MPNLSADPLFKVKVAAERLDISERTLRRMMAMGQIGFVKRGHYIRLPLSALNRYVEDGMRPVREQRTRRSA